MTLDPEVWVWLITTIIGLIAAIWAIVEAWSDYQIAKIGRQSRKITPLAVDDTRADIFQESLTLTIFIIAGVLVTSVIIPIRELIPYIVWGLNAILICVIIKLLLRRLNRRLLWRKAGISRKRVK
jgi:hypothetical protein